MQTIEQILAENYMHKLGLIDELFEERNSDIFETDPSYKTAAQSISFLKLLYRTDDRVYSKTMKMVRQLRKVIDNKKYNFDVNDHINNVVMTCDIVDIPSLTKFINFIINTLISGLQVNRDIIYDNLKIPSKLSSGEEGMYSTDVVKIMRIARKEKRLFYTDEQKFYFNILNNIYNYTGGLRNVSSYSLENMNLTIMNEGVKSLYVQHNNRQKLNEELANYIKSYSFNAKDLEKTLVRIHALNYSLYRNTLTGLKSLNNQKNSIGMRLLVLNYSTILVLISTLYLSIMASTVYSAKVLMVINKINSKYGVKGEF